jgi:hypothetical protein
VARKEIVSVLEKLGLKYAQANDGLEAWEKRLKAMAMRAPPSERQPLKKAGPVDSGRCRDAGNGRLRPDPQHQDRQSLSKGSRW